MIDSPAESLEAFKERISRQPDYQRIIEVLHLLEQSIRHGQMPISAAVDVHTVCQFARERTTRPTDALVLEEIRAMNLQFMSFMDILSSGEFDSAQHAAGITEMMVKTAATEARVEGFLYGILFHRRGGKTDPDGDENLLIAIKAYVDRLHHEPVAYAEIAYKQYVDVESMLWIMFNQVQNMLKHSAQSTTRTEDEYRGLLAGMWVEGFTFGAYFEQLGGHRDLKKA